MTSRVTVEALHEDLAVTFEERIDETEVLDDGTKIERWGSTVKKYLVKDGEKREFSIWDKSQRLYVGLVEGDE
jgi:hypothetical protein